MTLLYFFKCFISMGICWGLYKLILEDRKSFLFNRAYLLLTIVGLPLIPFITLPAIATKQVAPLVSHLDITPILTQPLAGGQTLVYSMEPTQGLPFTFHWSWIFYVVGMMILTRLFYNILKLSWQARRDYQHHKDSIRLIQSNYKNTPFSFFNNVFVSTQELNEGLPEEVWIHELCHIKHYHTLDRILAELIFTIQWWNPFAYLLTRSLKENHEYTADSYSISSYGASEKLLHKLLSSPRSRDNEVLLRIGFTQTSLSKRIKMIKSNRKELRPIFRLIVVLVLVTLIISCTDSVNDQYSLDDSPVDLSIVKDEHTSIEYVYPTFAVNRVIDPHFLTGFPEYKAPSIELFEKFKKDPLFDIVLDGLTLDIAKRSELNYNKIKAYNVYDISHLDGEIHYTAELYSKHGYLKKIDEWVELESNNIEELKKEIKKYLKEDPLDVAMRKYKVLGGAPESEIPKRKILSEQKFDELRDATKYNVYVDYDEISSNDFAKYDQADFSYYITDQISIGRRAKINLITNETFDLYISRMKHGVAQD